MADVPRYNRRSGGAGRDKSERREAAERYAAEAARSERLLALEQSRKGRRLKPPETDALVVVDHVSKVYVPSPPWMRLLLRSSIRRPVVALEDFSLDVQPGQILAVVGPNGAGKSTLFRVLTGLTTPTSGRAYVCGLDVTQKSHEVRRLIGFAPADEKTLLLRNTCRENLVFHGQLQGIPKRRLMRRVNETLDFVGLGNAADRVGIALSSGMKARLQLARALLHRPQVLILDEPTSAVDPVAAYELLELIKQVVKDQNAAALISSHRLEEIEALHNDVVLLDEGLIKYRGNLDTLRSIWEEPRLEITFHAELECLRAYNQLQRIPEVEVVGVEGTTLTLATSIGLGKLFALANGEMSGVQSIQELKLPLRELLAKILIDKADQPVQA
ncbi:MAG TPA: ABC transporter ATP-binding protein [Acidimicrobiia bacterium]|nr:ABC transporter ATP-binding protein [Acidimicrobiia bacterium]